MRAPNVTLKKLVELKRQKAEQRFLSVRLELDQIEREIQELQKLLEKTLETDADFAAQRLSHQQNYIENTIAKIEAFTARSVALQPEMKLAQTELKKAMHSADRLDAMS